MTSVGDPKAAASPAPAPDRWGPALRTVGIGLAFTATLTSLALPIGVAYLAYQRWIAGHSLQEASLQLEDALLLLQAVASLLVLAAALAWVVFFQQRFDRQGDLRALGFGRVRRGWLSLGAALIGGMLFAAMLIGLAWVSGQLGFGASHASREGTGDVILDALGSAVMLAGLIVAEELVFRGYMPWTLERSGWTALAATITPALLFTGYRLLLAPASWAVVLNVLAAAVFLTMLTRRTRSLHVSIGARLGWALIVGPVFSFPAGGSSVEGILHSLPVPGLVLDRAFGPEGSWLPLPLLLLGIVITQAASRRRPA